MSQELIVPPLDGSVTVLPGFVDFQAKHNPNRPWVFFPPTSASKRTSFTYGELSDATHRIARFYCPSGVRANGEIMAVIAHPDSVLYLALVAGLARAGFVVSYIVRRMKPFILKTTSPSLCPLGTRYPLWSTYSTKLTATVS